MERKCCRDCALQMPLTCYGTCWECHANEFASLRASNERMREALNGLVGICDGHGFGKDVHGNDRPYITAAKAALNEDKQ